MRAEKEVLPIQGTKQIFTLGFDSDLTIGARKRSNGSVTFQS